MNAEPTSNRILLIDDNRAIHEDFKKILISESNENLATSRGDLFGDAGAASQNPSFILQSAFQGQEGLQHVEAASAANCPYAMAFVDMRMPPGWDGVETIARIWDVYPDLQVVICTAYSDYTLEEMIARLGRTDRFVILKKPFDNVEVLQLACAFTEKWRLLQKTRSLVSDLEERVRERTRMIENAYTRIQSEIAERNALEVRVRHTQKIDSIGQLAAGVAHDFNNLLVVMQGHAELLLMDEPKGTRAADSLKQISSAARRAGSLTRQLLLFSRKQAMAPRLMDFNDGVRELSKMLDRVLGEDVVLQCNLSKDRATILADPSMMEQVLMNLAVNARDAMPAGGQLTIETEMVEVGTEFLRREAEATRGMHLRVTVRDTGKGIPPEILPRIFEPFFTTKEIGKGTGLGLATVYGIIKQHHGWIDVSSEAGRGSVFQFYLPMAAPHARVQETPCPVEELEKGGETLLLVEDDAALRDLARTILCGVGYKVHEAASAPDAVKVYDDISGQIDLLLTDLIMPGGMTGRELATALKERNPNLKLIVSSGYSADLGDTSFVNRQGIRFLSKPYDPQMLCQTVRECLNASN